MKIMEKINLVTSSNLANFKTLQISDTQVEMSGSLLRNAYQNYLSCLFIAADFYPSSVLCWMSVCGRWIIEGKVKGMKVRGEGGERLESGFLSSGCQVV